MIEYPQGALLLDRLLLADVVAIADASGLYTAKRARHHINRTDSRATLALLRSVGEKTVVRPHMVEEQIVALRYGRDLDKGVEPGGPRPDADDILVWMSARKLRTYKGQSRQKAARNIAANIAKEGREPRHIFEDALEDFRQHFLPAIQRRASER